ncbi:MAG: DUF1292 domain-containing protein [Clostridiales bacterium]|nr:DUF1292 domain-containing protein [Clostridiales bacterium]
MEEFDTTITLTDDDGNEVTFDIADYVEVDGKEYVVLVPQDEDDDEVLILRVEDGETEDEELFVGEDDEEVLEKVFQIFKQRFEDEYEFTDAE